MHIVLLHSNILVLDDKAAALESSRLEVCNGLGVQPVHVHGGWRMEGRGLNVSHHLEANKVERI